MENTYIKIGNGVQSNEILSFIGGVPRLEPGQDIPICELCGNSQTFFLVIAFPNEHAWHDLSLSLFQCTSCSNEDYLIPHLPTPLEKAIVMENIVLNKNRKNYSILISVTKKAILSKTYVEKIIFRPLIFAKGTIDNPFFLLGGKPKWLLSDESPLSIDKTQPIFLFQLPIDIEYEVIDSAPGQIELAYFSEEKTEESKDRFYNLFIGNALYLFGSNTEKKLVYPLVQC